MECGEKRLRLPFLLLDFTAKLIHPPRREVAGGQGGACGAPSDSGVVPSSECQMLKGPSQVFSRPRLSALQELNRAEVKFPDVIKGKEASFRALGA